MEEKKTSSNIEKDKVTKGKISKLKKIFKEIDSNKKLFADKLISQLIFMENTLDELQETIKDEGAVMTGINGNGFKVVKEHPAQKSYNVMIKNYNATMSNLINLIPKDDIEDDEAMQFIKQNI